MLDSAANTTYTVEVFWSPAADSSGYGEGRYYLGSVTVTTDASGHAAFAKVFAGRAPAGAWVTATATDPGGNTSEFSLAVQIP